MIILDLHESKQIAVEIMGNRNEFYQVLNYIKNLSQATYNDEDKVWLLPRQKNYMERLENNFKTAYKKDKYTLLGTERPYVKTGADDLIDTYNTVNNFISYFDVKQVYNQLYDFQKLGVASALYHLSKSNGFLIADDMGSGKTVQALGVIEALKSIDKVDKILITCPKKVLYQWGDEIEKFTDYSYVVIDSYSKEKRLEYYDEDVEIYIINHNKLILDDDFDNLSQLNFNLLVADEIHYFKNRETQRAQAVKDLADNINYTLGLTGTPMQNKPEDTFSIFELLIPNYLGDWNGFSNKYICWRYINGNPRPVGYHNLEKLNEKVAQKMIRRESEDIDNNLPTVHKKDHYVEFTPLQNELFNELNEIIEEKISESTSGDLNEEELEEIDGTIMGMKNIKIEVSDDPRLLNESSSYWIREMSTANENFRPPKLTKLKELVVNILNYNDEFKLVIFTKFRKMVFRIQDELSELDCVQDTVLIHGNISNKQVHENKIEFKENDNCRILISSDAGAEGLDLQNASHLINYDLPWSPTKLDQRNGRIRRIGSPWDDVYISNILTENSIDERIKDVLKEKREIYDIIISNTENQKKALKKFVNKNIV